MFQFNSKAAKESQPVVRQYLQAGIHENCIMVENGIRKTNNGIEYVMFLFKQEETELYSELKVWFPDQSKVTPREGETQEQAYQRDINRALSQLLHTVETCTMGGPVDISATSFEDFAKKILAVLQRRKPVKIRLKQIYDKNGMYASFPVNLPYFEVQDENATRLFFTKFEIENRMKKATAPSESTVIPNQSNNTEDLPF